MKNLVKILIVIISINFISCGSSKKIIEESKEETTVKETYNFHKLKSYDYTVYLKDNTRYSATVKVKTNDSISALDLAHKYVEGLYTGQENKVSYIEVKPSTNKYGFITLK